MDLPSTRQVASDDGSLEALARLGYCTTKTEEKWIIRNSRSGRVIEDMESYDNNWDAQQVCDWLNSCVKNQEIELLTGFRSD